MTELQRTVERVLFDHRDRYVASAEKIVWTIGTRARSSFDMSPCDLADVDEETRLEYLTAAALGLAAGQTEVALSLAPGPGKTHAYMDAVLRTSAAGFEDAVAGYLVKAGHYVARQRLARDPGVVGRGSRTWRRGLAGSLRPPRGLRARACHGVPSFRRGEPGCAYDTCWRWD